MAEAARLLLGVDIAHAGVAADRHRQRVGLEIDLTVERLGLLDDAAIAAPRLAVVDAAELEQAGVRIDVEQVDERLRVGRRP